MCSKFVFFLTIVIVSVSVSGQSCQSERQPEAEEVSNFPANFFEQCAESTEENVIVSPYSVFLALALLSQGANGDTFEELQDGLGVDSDKAELANQISAYNQQLKESSGSLTLSIGNKIYIEYGYQLNETFEEVAVEKFASSVESLNFADSVQSADTINEWVEDATNDKIQDIVSPDSLSADTRLVLVNAIYFKGNWTHSFNADDTFQGNFYIGESGSDATPVQFMTIEKKFNYAVLQDLDATAVELTYANSSFSFVVVLPNERTGVEALQESLRTYDWTSITDQMQSQQVNVTIPKFTAEFEIDLTEALTNLGMGGIFSPDADLSGLLDDSEQLYVSSVTHKASVVVNEKGSEAAAATSIGVRALAASVPLEPVIFQADHPFIYFIEDTAGKVIFFSGRAITIESSSD